jgi:hypothetical protein
MENTDNLRFFVKLVGYYGTSWSLDEQGSMMTVTLVVNCFVT